MAFPDAFKNAKKKAAKGKAAKGKKADAKKAGAKKPEGKKGFPFPPKGGAEEEEE